MKDKQSESKQAAELRQRAEAQVRARDVAQPAQLTPAQTGQLTYELQVHQVELEIQNEELRQTHAVLTASQARYFDLYDLAPVGYLTLSGNGLIQEANLTAATLLGVARTALIQGTFISFVFKDDQDKFHRYLHQLGTAPAPAGAGQPQQCEVRLLRAQAAPFWAQLEATVMHDAAGVQGRNIVVIDITSRKLAEEALTKMSSLILESQRIAHLGSFEYVADTGITIWSEEEFKIYGLDPSGPSPDYEVMLAKHIHPDDAAHLNEVFVNAMHNGAIYELEHRIVQPDGSVRFVHDRAHPIFDSQGKLLRYVGATLDITERKITEKKMEMIQSELMQAQKMESVGRLAGGVAHDFNNLLMGIMGYAELGLLDLPPEHPVRGELESIIATAKRSADLTRQLLAFARKQIIAPKVLDLNDTVESMLKLLRRLVGEDINLEWQPGANLPPVKLDPTQVDQVLANLCVNARDAIAGIGKLTIATSVVELDQSYCAIHADVAPGAYVLLTVSDDGCGMTPDVLASIFEPFFTTKSEGKGTGLGLATVYGIVKQNRGSIDVCSEPGLGTTFKIYLPQYTGDVAEAVPANVAETPRGHGETVLLVEDSDELRAICIRILDSIGYKTLVAENGPAALGMASLHAGEIQLLLTDVIIPGMDGRQLAEKLGTIKPGIKVLFMSGYTADVIAKQGALEEGPHFIQKPFTRETLAVALHNRLMNKDITSEGVMGSSL